MNRLLLLLSDNLPVGNRLLITSDRIDSIKLSKICNDSLDRDSLT